MDSTMQKEEDFTDTSPRDGVIALAPSHDEHDGVGVDGHLRHDHGVQPETNDYRHHEEEIIHHETAEASEEEEAKVIHQQHQQGDPHHEHVVMDPSVVGVEPHPGVVHDHHRPQQPNHLHPQHHHHHPTTHHHGTVVTEHHQEHHQDHHHPGQHQQPQEQHEAQQQQPHIPGLHSMNVWEAHFNVDIGTTAKQVNQWVRDVAATEGKELMIEDLPADEPPKRRSGGKNSKKRKATAPVVVDPNGEVPPHPEPVPEDEHGQQDLHRKEAEQAGPQDQALSASAPETSDDAVRVLTEFEMFDPTPPPLHPTTQPRPKKLRRRKNQGGNRTVFVCADRHCIFRCVVRRKQGARGTYNSKSPFRLYGQDSILAHSHDCESVYKMKVRDLQNNSSFIYQMEKCPNTNVQEAKLALGSMLADVPNKTIYRAIVSYKAARDKAINAAAIKAAEEANAAKKAVNEIVEKIIPSIEAGEHSAAAGAGNDANL